MAFSVKTILHKHTGKDGMNRVLMQVYYNKVKLYPAAGFKVKPEQWRNNQVINHELKAQMNNVIKRKKIELEALLLSLHDKNVSAKELSELIAGKNIPSATTLNFVEFIYEFIEDMRHKFSEGRLRHYKVIAGKVSAFEPGVLITDINGTWLQKFENWLFDSGMKSGTVKSKIAMIKALVNAADKKGLLQANFRGYKNVKVIADEPEFLNENELQAFFNVARAIIRESVKLAGYYYLLSCFTGFRIGTAKKFVYASFVKGDEIFIRANKNNKNVYIPIYPELAEVLEYIKDKPLLLSEDKTRIYVKQIATLAGIKKNVKYHSSRHTATTRFAMKGLTQKEVAEIIGDTEIVSKIYTHLDKKEFKQKFLKVMG